MKKRVLAALLALTLLVSLVPSAFALGAFSDVSDEATARNVEVLRLMGVIGGDGDGRFRPMDTLTRAEFCKMAVVMQGRGDEVLRYRTHVVFPDVRASHWAAGYVNLATTPAGENTPALMHGNPDGTFLPDRKITFGEAVTVLMRSLGYTDKDSGGVWPQGYLDLAAAKGLSRGLSLSGAAAITRAQAAQLFVNVLGTPVKGDTQEYAFGTLEKEATLRAVDLATGKLRTSAGEYEMMKPASSTVLVGLKGRVVTKGGKALTFLPSSNIAGSTVSDAAVIVQADGSAAGLDALTGGTTNYSIYRNGVKTTAKSLKRYDVATYNAATNAVVVTDVRVAACYESCDPSPSAPVTVTALNTVFHVVPTAQQSLSMFKPGQEFVLLLTADGRVAGATERGAGGAQGNAFAYVDDAGKASLICGSALIPLSWQSTKNVGQLGRISQSKFSSGPVVQFNQQNGGVRGAIDVAARTVGSYRMADNVQFIVDGALITLGELTRQNIPADEVRYANLNSDGKVNLVALGIRSEFVIGRVTIFDTKDGDELVHHMRLSRPGQADLNSDFVYNIESGVFVATQINKDGNFINMTALTMHADVPASAWIGETAVNLGKNTYTLSPELMCFNADSGTWFADLAAAKAYGGTMSLFTRNGVVYGLIVRS